MIRYWSILAAALVAVSTMAIGPLRAQGQGDVFVFAAASLKNALDEIASTWTTNTGRKVTISYAATSALVRQIEQGAPAEVFISADLEWMDYAEKKSLIQPSSRVNILGNRLVLVGPKGATPSAIGPDLSSILVSRLGDSRLATAQVASVPAGKYAKAALQSLQAWNAVKDRLAEAESVRAALIFVARGEAPLGIVYLTDAKVEPNVSVVGTFPASSHPDIVYPAALTATATDEGRAFFTFLGSSSARAAFERQGFTYLAAPRTN